MVRLPGFARQALVSFWPLAVVVVVVGAVLLLETTLPARVKPAEAVAEVPLLWLFGFPSFRERRTPLLLVRAEPAERPTPQAVTVAIRIWIPA